MPMTTQLTRQKTQDVCKRKSILDASIRVFAESGFRNADVDVIAHAAGVGKGTVYRYFGNKESLFRAAADSGLRQLEAKVLKILEQTDDPVQVIRRGARAYAAFFQEHPELVEILIIERAEFRDAIPATHLVYREKNRAVLEDVLRRGMKAGQLRQTNVREAMNALSNMLYGIVVCGCLEGASQNLRRTANHAVDIFLKGLLPTVSQERGED